MSLVEVLIESLTLNGSYTDVESQPVDIIADILIWCAENDINVDEVLGLAKSSYEAEVS